MKKNSNKNTEGLKKFAEKKNQETIEKVNKAIDKLKRSKTKTINFKTVAEEAGVSKATLYNNDILKERILSLRAIQKGVPNDSIVATPKDKIKTKDIDKDLKELEYNDDRNFLHNLLSFVKRYVPEVYDVIYDYVNIITN